MISSSSFVQTFPINAIKSQQLSLRACANSLTGTEVWTENFNRPSQACKSDKMQQNVPDFEIVDSSGNLVWGLIHLVQDWLGGILWIRAHHANRYTFSTPKKYVELVEMNIWH